MGEDVGGCHDGNYYSFIIYSFILVCILTYSLTHLQVRMVSNPRSLDTIVGTNLHMDILSDLAAALAGSIGIAPSSNLDPTRRFPSLFEPVHGSAFDISGKGIANPIGAIWSASEMLKWIGEEDAGEKLIQAVECVCDQGLKTRDLGGHLNTAEFVQAVLSTKEFGSYLHTQ